LRHRILPFHVLNEIALLGDTVTSADLHRWGAVNRLAADGAVDKTAGERAGRLAAGSTLSMGQRAASTGARWSAT
jgi:2-(1,2-epoxy-1,2-dihydrophenyl)acetyl-CoA isomerase